MSKKKHRKAKSKSGPSSARSRNQVKAAEPEVPKSPPNLAARAWLAVGALVLVQGAVWGAREFVLPSSVRPLSRSLSELPYEIGGYTGEDTDEPAHVAKIVAGEDGISRMYRRPDGRWISLHCAAWAPTDDFFPHSPEVCFPAQGWVQQSRDTVRLDTDPPIDAGLLTFTEEGQRVQVLYWYRMDEATFLTMEEARRARQQYWNAGEWSPIVKVMLHTNESERSERELKEFAELMDEWTREL